MPGTYCYSLSTPVMRCLSAILPDAFPRCLAPIAPLSPLSDQDRALIKLFVEDCAQIFQRSSSCVEARNGHLSLFHHGQHRLSQRKLKALTTVHNYFKKRPDGTTSAQRFFEQEHEGLFDWLLRRLPVPPRPAKSKTSAAN
jgi:hypothetical protein